jgi:hypothetical protein
VVDGAASVVIEECISMLGSAVAINASMSRELTASTARRWSLTFCSDTLV